MYLCLCVNANSKIAPVRTAASHFVVREQITARKNAGFFISSRLRFNWLAQLVPDVQDNSLRTVYFHPRFFERVRRAL